MTEKDIENTMSQHPLIHEENEDPQPLFIKTYSNTHGHTISLEIHFGDIVKLVPGCDLDLPISVSEQTIRRLNLES